MLLELLEGTVSTGANRQALVSAKKVWTYADLSNSVEERATELSTKGVEPGRVYAIDAHAEAQTVIDFLAYWRIGASIAPLDPRLTRLEKSRAVEVLDGLETDARAILWTSGTGGPPRGVLFTLDNICASAEAVTERLDLGSDNVWLLSLSPAHVGGLALVTRSFLLGCTLVACGSFRADIVSQLIEGEGLPGSASPVTHMSLVPTQLIRLLGYRDSIQVPASFKCGLIGGAHASLDLIQRSLAAGWPLALTYGMTEMTSQVATAVPSEVKQKPGSVGRALMGTKIKIDNDGQILTQGPTLAQGYVGITEPLADAEGWYPTGDLGHFDEDGDLWITGRRSDRIVSGGITINATHIEDVLCEHEGVQDACVVGIQDVEWGEIVGAWVVPTGDGLELDLLEEYVRKSLGEAKRPRVWLIGGEIPRNANGKVERSRVRSALEPDVSQAD
ncbi:MAG: 2-succinylbenzoate-CoA ligase [Euryarchaeota archaeon]|nr:2-succinylbenzoate-CoA ligase [Euryarchaeota archaeon]